MPWRLSPQPKNNLGGQERLWPHGYCMELYGIAQRTIFVGRNDYGSAMRKETRRGSASYALVWNESHPMADDIIRRQGLAQIDWKPWKNVGKRRENKSNP